MNPPTLLLWRKTIVVRFSHSTDNTNVTSPRKAALFTGNDVWAYVLYADKVTRPPQRIIRLAANRTRRRHKPVLRYGHKKADAKRSSFTSFGNSARQSARQRGVRQACVIHMKSQEIKQLLPLSEIPPVTTALRAKRIFRQNLAYRTKNSSFKKSFACSNGDSPPQSKAKSAVSYRQPISTRCILLLLLTLRVPRRQAAIFPLFCFPVPP